MTAIYIFPPRQAALCARVGTQISGMPGATAGAPLAQTRKDEKMERKQGGPTLMSGRSKPTSHTHCVQCTYDGRGLPVEHLPERHGVPDGQVAVNAHGRDGEDGGRHGHTCAQDHWSADVAWRRGATA